jgi:hypothetical protein
MVTIMKRHLRFCRLHSLLVQIHNNKIDNILLDYSQFTRKSRKDPDAPNKDDTTTPKKKRAPRKKQPKPPTDYGAKTDKEECGICLEPLVKKTTLSNCKHAYCWECIVQWADITNQCPLCKVRDFMIVQNLTFCSRHSNNCHEKKMLK